MNERFVIAKEFERIMLELEDLVYGDEPEWENVEERETVEEAMRECNSGHAIIVNFLSEQYRKENPEPKKEAKKECQ